MVSSAKPTSAAGRKRPPARTPEDRENQLMASAIDLVEKQIAEGTVSSQVLTHYIRMSSSRNRLEEQKLRLETERIRVQNDDILRAREREEDYDKVLIALRRYQGDTSDHFD